MVEVGEFWVRDSIKLLSNGGIQLDLRGGCRETALHNVVTAVLHSALLQAERDDQQAVIYCVVCVYEKLGWPRPNYEAVRRCVQKFQNEYGIARISEAERRVREAKQRFVSEKWGRR